LYGGAAEKLYEFMKAARDKGTGKLVFPDLKEEDVMEWYEAWQKYHPETKAFQDLIEALAKREGYTAASLGAQRKRFFPGGANKPGATYNHKIQSTAAELANAALLQIAKNIPYGQWSQFSGPCLQVHDALCVYVPKDRAEEAKKIIEAAMNTSIFGIPITATSGVSDSLAGQ
jgi:DNA polymerase I-like protein with 3'-5' exonuclease and polymerase domains